MGILWLIVVLILFCVPLSSAATYPAVQTFNSSCRRNTDCASDFDPTFLFCDVFNRCTCEPHTFYDNYEKMCRIKHLSKCKIKRDPSVKGIQPCVRFAHCVYPLDVDGNELKSSREGTCACLVNRPPNPDGTCGGSSSVRHFGPHFALLSSCIVLFINWPSGIVR